MALCVVIMTFFGLSVIYILNLDAGWLSCAQPRVCCDGRRWQMWPQSRRKKYDQPKARFIVIQNVDDVDMTSSLSIRSSVSREHVALQFYMPVGGCGCVFVWFQGL